MLHSLLCVALAGTKLLQNDGFTGAGGVNANVSFGEYEGAAALFRPDGGYPLKVIAVDVFAIDYQMNAPGAFAPFVCDVWDESGGYLVPTPASQPDGGGPSYAPRRRETIQLNTSRTNFNRITLTSPLIVDGGNIFVSLGNQSLGTSLDDTTIAHDSTPQVPGVNFYRGMTGLFQRLDLPDGGFYRGINHNWIIRVVLEVAGGGGPVTVTSIVPNSGPNTSTRPVVINGTNFEAGATARVGNTALAITGAMPPTQISATVPAGMPPGFYDVTVQNPGGASGVLPMGYQVTSGSAGGTGGSGGSAGGTAGGSGGSGGGAGGGSSGALTVESIDPQDGFNEETTAVVIVGTGFKPDAQVLIGPNVLDTVTVKSASVIDADVPAGLVPGVYDVTVINLDGERAKLEKAFTVYAGTRAKPGCGCGAAPVEGWALLLVALAAARRHRRHQ